MKKEKAYEAIFRQYYPALCNYVHGYVKDRDIAKDVVQSTFLKVWKNWDSFKDATSQKSYLFRAVKNTLLDRIKKRERVNISEGRYNEISKSDDDKIESLIIRSEILKSLNKLKPKVSKIFKLNKLEGLTYPEIAKYLDISERSVEDNMARAIKALRKDLRKNDIFK